MKQVDHTLGKEPVEGRPGQRCQGGGGSLKEKNLENLKNRRRENQDQGKMGGLWEIYPEILVRYSVWGSKKPPLNCTESNAGGGAKTG